MVTVASGTLVHWLVLIEFVNRPRRQRNGCVSLFASREALIGTGDLVRIRGCPRSARKFIAQYLRSSSPVLRVRTTVPDAHEGLPLKNGYRASLERWLIRDIRLRVLQRLNGSAINTLSFAG